MVGDFNCDMTLGLDSSESHLRKRFKIILCSYSLKNIINSPTHITFDSRSLIDVIAKSQPAKIQTSGSIDLEIYDHHLIFAVFKVARNNPKPLVISTKKYKEVDKKHLNTDFEHATCLFDDIGDCHFVWNYLFKDIMDHHLPSQKAKIRPNTLPWIDSSIREEMNKR